MALIVQHIPNFFTGVSAKRVYFDTQEELLNIPFVHSFSVTEEGDKDSYFHRYSLDRESNMLMAECRDGMDWWVIGDIDDATNLTLPEWEPANEENP